MLDQKISELQSEIERILPAIADNDALEKFRIEFLSRSGKLASLYEELKAVPGDQKPVEMPLPDKRCCFFTGRKWYKELNSQGI